MADFARLSPASIPSQQEMAMKIDYAGRDELTLDCRALCASAELALLSTGAVNVAQRRPTCWAVQ